MKKFYILIFTIFAIITILFIVKHYQISHENREINGCAENRYNLEHLATHLDYDHYVAECTQKFIKGDLNDR